jgi:hypothetical protein
MGEYGTGTYNSLVVLGRGRRESSGGEGRVTGVGGEHPRPLQAGTKIPPPMNAH